MRRSHLHLLALLLTSWLFPVDTARCQTLVPSRVDRIGNSVAVRFDTVPGRVYRIEHTADFVNWTFYPDTIYGLGQNARYHVYDAPAANQTVLPPPGEQPAEHLFFMVNAFADGSAVVTWDGSDGSPARAYVAAFDLVYQNEVMQEIVRGNISATAPALPYHLEVWSMPSPKPASVESLPAPASEQATLTKLTSQHAWVRSQMIAAVDWRATHPTPPPEPERLFDDRGEPMKQFFRVREYTTDSNFDHVTDDVQFAAGQNPFNQDSDGDGIPNGYDRDLWPAAQYPGTNVLLSNVLINEVLMSNEFTNADEDGGANDWVELFNPTNDPIDISGWYLSDSSGPGLTPDTQRRKWTFPATTIIGSGQFLTVWASNKNRVIASSPLHTSFELRAGDPDANPPAVPEPIVLSRPNPLGGTAIIVDAFLTTALPSPDLKPVTANFGGQRTDISFGRYPTATGLQTGYMVLPTPGANGTHGPVGQHNVVGARGFTPSPVFTSASSAPGLYESETVTAVLAPAAPGDAIHFTTNSANPTRYSELYTVPLAANRTVILRAIAAREGYIPSRSVTRSYLFKEDILGTASAGTIPTNHQGSRNAGSFLGLLRGYPEASDGGVDFPLLYGMDAETIKNRKAILSQELSAAPIVSLVVTVPDCFDLAAGGIYANSTKTDHQPPIADPRGRDWQRFSSFEFIEADKSASTQVNACLLITGGSSIENTTTRKHNLRVEFDSVHGAKELLYPLFPDFVQNAVVWDLFKSIHLKNPTHDSWSNTCLPGGYLNVEPYAVSQVATYCNETWVNAAHRAMGHEGPRMRWVHLYINGIYWGPYQLVERIDDDFMDAHFGTGEYHVIKQGPSALDGNVAEWYAVVNACLAVQNALPADQPARYAEVEALLDLDNYIDYLICNTYANNNDFCENNWRAAKRNGNGHKWRFFVWDTEATFRPGEHKDGLGGGLSPDPAARLDCAGVIELHLRLRGYAPYRQRFSARLHLHFDAPGGALAVAGDGTDRAVMLFQDAMARFQQVLFCESARWGAMDAVCAENPAPFTKSDPNYQPAKPYGDWDRNTAYRVNVWLPERRAYYLSRMQAIDLYQP